MEKVKIVLDKPIQAHGEELKELELRPPVGKDIRIFGFPYMMDGDEKIVFDGKATAKYITELASIPASSVDLMSPADFQKCFKEIMRFFGPAQAT